MPIDCSDRAAGQDRDRHRRQREDEAEHQPGRQEQPDRIVEVEAEPIVAAAALGHQPQRQPHQRAERRLDRADVDGGYGEQEEKDGIISTPRVAAARRPGARARASARSGLRAGRRGGAGGLPRRAMRPRSSRVVVVVAQKVKETMKGQNAQLGGIRVPSLARLPPGDAGGNHEVAEEARFGGLPPERRKPHHPNAWLPALAGSPPRETTARRSRSPCRGIGD